VASKSSVAAAVAKAEIESWLVGDERAKDIARNSKAVSAVAEGARCYSAMKSVAVVAVAVVAMVVVVARAKVGGRSEFAERFPVGRSWREGLPAWDLVAESELWVGRSSSMGMAEDIRQSPVGTECAYTHPEDIGHVGHIGRPEDIGHVGHIGRTEDIAAAAHKLVLSGVVLLLLLEGSHIGHGFHFGDMRRIHRCMMNYSMFGNYRCDGHNWASC
jgi:hypothetical protein